ncbi:MAG: type III restriction endonuclease subunit M [Gammaproteobacteria bacterium]|nr:MAG: type III restriction endonuclease subunit M [Gammaproteobacteria bacterium]
MNTLKSIILTTLQQDDRLYNEDKKQLNQTLLLDLLEKIDKPIITLLLQNQTLKDKFFIKINDSYVFKANDFQFFMEEHKIDNSYTSYKNRLGLTDGTRFLKDTDDVVLDFPFKDCVLEGGQSTEEGADDYFEWQEDKLKDKIDENGNKIKDGIKNVKEVDVPAHYEKKRDKRDEIFFNQVLAYDEKDRLFDEKALVNFIRHNKDGQQKVNNIKRDENGTIKENLIIKGNNLLALHSLKKQFTGKIKLIYIDPPYNTGNDGFKYNDNFNHSTWLTFMKNRLEVARDLLKDDGVIFVQIDDDGMAYLKVLMDEVFGENFVNCIIPEMSNLSGNKIEHAIQGRKFPKIKEYILLYAKNKNNCTLTIPKKTKNEWDAEYNIIFPELTLKEFEKIENLIADSNHEELNDFLKNHKIESLIDYLRKNNIENIDEWKIQNSFRILASKPNTALRKKALELNFDTQIASLKNSRGDVKIIRTDFNKDTETARIELVFAKNNLEVFYGDIWHDITTTGGVAQEGGVVLKNGKKPEQLLEIILKSSTKPNDIVLDYHLGSGTTAAVAHKMGRQYIGIEQLYYGENDSVVRLQNVINGDKSGVSKAVSWQGGGDFIYCELAKWNETAKEEILKKESLDELMKFFKEMSQKYFLNYNLKIKEFNEKIITEENFKNLTLNEQKQMFITMLDNNQMYTNKTEIADAKYAISAENQKLTDEFYSYDK